MDITIKIDYNYNKQITLRHAPCNGYSFFGLFYASINMMIILIANVQYMYMLQEDYNDCVG